MGSLEEAVSARKRALDASASYLQFLWKADLVESWIREWVGLVNKWVELRTYVRVHSMLASGWNSWQER